MKVKIVQETPVKKSSLSGIVSVSISLPATSSSPRKSPPLPPAPVEEGSWYNKTTGLVDCSYGLIECNEELITCL